MGETYGKVAEMRTAVATGISQPLKCLANWMVPASSFVSVEATTNRSPVSEEVALKMTAGRVPFQTSCLQSLRSGGSFQPEIHAFSKAHPRSRVLGMNA